MIDSKDLRIGNIVLGSYLSDEDKGLGVELRFRTELLQVETIHSDGINYVDGHIYGTEFKDLTPIKLTPEILEQVGFKYSNGLNEYALNNGFRLGVNENGVIVYEFENYLIPINYIEIKYLHDLQNLYYYHNNKQELPIDINTLKT